MSRLSISLVLPRPGGDSARRAQSSRRDAPRGLLDNRSLARNARKRMQPLRIKTQFSKYLDRWSKDIATLRQNWLLNQSAFFSFARDRSAGLKGVLAVEPLDYYRRCWLS